jgi:hypothetical protein
METQALKPGDTVSVAGYRGIAFYVRGPERVFEPDTYLCTDPNSGEEYEEYSGEGEWIDGDGSRLRVVMVGDDREHIVDATDCTPISKKDYCPECGQMGCGHGR